MSGNLKDNGKRNLEFITLHDFPSHISGIPLDEEVITALMELGVDLSHHEEGKSGNSKEQIGYLHPISRLPSYFLEKQMVGSVVIFRVTSKEDGEDGRLVPLEDEHGVYYYLPREGRGILQTKTHRAAKIGGKIESELMPPREALSRIIYSAHGFTLPKPPLDVEDHPFPSTLYSDISGM